MSEPESSRHLVAMTSPITRLSCGFKLLVSTRAMLYGCVIALARHFRSFEKARRHRLLESAVLAVLLFSSTLAFAQELTVQQQVALHKQRAQEFLRAKALDRAITEFRSILVLDPDNVDARGNLGVLLYFHGDYQEAVSDLEATLKLEPALWKVQAVLGMAQRRLGDGTNALNNLEQAFPRIEDNGIQTEVGMELVEIYAGGEQLAKAAGVLQTLREKFPTDLEVLYASYRIYSDLAGESMLSLSLVGPHSAQMHQLMAHELARQGDMNAAIQNYREALKVDPNLPGLHFELAEALNAGGAQQDKAEAKKEYEAALSVNNFDEKSECRLARMAYDAGDMQGAFSRYSNAERLQPDDPEAGLGLAKVLIARDETAKAQALVQRVLQIDPTNAEAHFRLAAIFRLERRFDDSKQEIQQFQKYKEIKEKLKQIYHDMRVRPVDEDTEEDKGTP